MNINPFYAAVITGPQAVTVERAEPPFSAVPENSVWAMELFPARGAVRASPRPGYQLVLPAHPTQLAKHFLPR